MSAAKRYYQEVDIKAVLKHYVDGFKLPDNAVVLDWDANYDPRTGRVWFKLLCEEPAPDKKNLIVLDAPCTRGNGNSNPTAG